MPPRAGWDRAVSNGNVQRDASAKLERAPAPQPRRCYIILVNWNGWQDTIDCLESLSQLNYPDFRVVVCDNNSSDGSLERIGAWAGDHAIPFTEVTASRGEVPPHSGEERLFLIHVGANLGFAGGNNVGIRHACADPACGSIWLLNNDTTVDPGALTAMSEEAERDPRVGAVGSVCYFASNPAQVQCWGGSQVNLWTGFVRTNTHPRPKAWFDYIYGASLLVKRETVESIGPMDDSYFLYYEETEYCLRMRAKGWHLAVAQKSQILHKVNASTGGASSALDRYFTASGLRLLRKYSPLPLIALPLFVMLRLAKRIVHLQFSRCGHVWQGVKDFYKLGVTSDW